MKKETELTTQLNAVYDIQKRNGRLLVFSKTERGILYVDKYLCCITKVEDGYQIDGLPVAKTFTDFKNQLDFHLANLEYHSDYYCPMIKKGLFEEYIITAYLKELGFKYFNTGYSDGFVLCEANIYGYKFNTITISIHGLNAWGREYEKDPSKVEIILYGNWAWMEKETPRNVNDIKKGIDSILKPLFLSDTAYNLGKAEMLLNNVGGDITSYKVTDEGILSSNYKANLKSKLLEAAAKL